jgi:hypothetical protein
MTEEDAGGRIDEEQVSEEVGGEIHEAKDAHKEQAHQPGATEGHGVEPAGTGYAPPDTGQGEAAESEVPEGVESLSAEQTQAAEERGGGGGDDGDDGGALDVSAAMAEGGDDADAAADDTGDDATEMTDADAQVAPDTGEDT